jgi:hypothetical protein
MKKYLFIILLAVSSLAYGQNLPHIFVGTNPNDGTGDNLRTTGLKLNQLVDSANALLYRIHQGLFMLNALKVGGSTGSARIDSITNDGSGIKMYSNGSQIPYAIPSSNVIHLSTYPYIAHVIPSSGDTSNYPIPGMPGMVYIDSTAQNSYLSTGSARNSWMKLANGKYVDATSSIQGQFNNTIRRTNNGGLIPMLPQGISADTSLVLYNGGIYYVINPYVVTPKTYYVSTSGSNSSSGLSTSTPWATLAYAQAHATIPGSIIALKKGDTFALDSVLEISHGGTVGSLIIWDGALWGSGANAIIKSNSDGAASPKWYALCHIAACNYLTMQNITFNGDNKNRYGIVIGGLPGMFGTVVQNAESHITIQDCSISNFGTGTFYCLGIEVQTNSNNISDITIQHNTIDGVGAEGIALYPGRSDLGATPSKISNTYIGYNTVTNFGRKNDGATGYGIMANNQCDNIIIEYNTISTGTNGYGNGITVASNEPIIGYYPTNVKIRYNTVTATQVNSFCVYIQGGQSVTTDLYYNLFIYNSGNTTATNGGCVLVDTPSPLTWTGAVINLWNNTMYSTAGRTFFSRCDVTGAVRVANCIMYNTGTDNYNQFCFNSYTGTGYTTHNNNAYYRSANVAYQKAVDNSAYLTNASVIGWEATAQPTNPTFTTPGSVFTLQAGSPCLNTGVVIPSIPQTDILGNPMNGLPDIGAYEKQ